MVKKNYKNNSHIKLIIQYLSLLFSKNAIFIFEFTKTCFCIFNLCFQYPPKQKKKKKNTIEKKTYTNRTRGPKANKNWNSLWFSPCVWDHLWFFNQSKPLKTNYQMATTQGQQQGTIMDPNALDDIIHRLTEVRFARPGKQVQLSESEIKQLCVASRDIFMRQPNLLELEAPMKICGTFNK